MLVALTGANGHLGGNVVQRLLAEGHEVRAGVHRNAEVLTRLGVQQVRADILGRETLTDLVKGTDAIIHMAAKISITGDRDGSVHRVNVDGTDNVAAAAHAAGIRMVHVSSVHAFDLAAPPAVIDESHAKSGARRYAYDRSKAAGEQRVCARVAAGLDATIVNPTGIIGPADHAPSRMGRFFLDVRDARLPALVGGGFDWVDVRDVAAAVVNALTAGAPGENHLLGGHFATVKETARVAADACGIRPPRFTVPLWLATAGVPFASLGQRGQPGYTFESLGALRHGKPVDHTKAARVLDHAPRPLAETVRDLYAWFESEGL